MTHDARESSRTKGAPINLYLFRGATAEVEVGAFDPGPLGPYAYTDADEAVTRTCFGDVVVFEPQPIGRDAIKASGSTDKQRYTVKLPSGVGVMAELRTWPPNQPLYLFIYEGHVGEDLNACPTVFAGKVLSWKDNPPDVALTCESNTTSVRRAIMSRNWQHGCPLQLYGPRCQADKAAATIVETVVSVTATTVGLAASWFDPLAADKYLGGFVGWTDGDGRPHLRSIIGMADANQTLRLSGPTTGLAASDSINVTLGCDHTRSDCLTLHANAQNYGGQPWIPNQNPIGGVNNFF